MKPCRAFLAVPGDLMSLTGGYLYDRRLLAELRALGRDVRHIALPDSFPDPSPADQAFAAAQLADASPGCPILVDGLALGALNPLTLAGVKAPIVALIHHPLAQESGLAARRRDALFRSERDILAGVSHVIATSPCTARLLTSRYCVDSTRITVARPGVDPPSADAPLADSPLILSVGIAVPRKGHDTLLHALARITDRTWDAVIVGEARDRGYAQQLEELVLELGLVGRVCLAGSVPASELARFYRRATVFALATRYEGHGIALDEAMTYGLPIVSCAVGAVPETVAPGAGRLVPADDPGAFAKALAAILDDEMQRSTMAKASKRAGAALPKWEETARQVAAVIDDVAARSSTEAR